MARFRPFDRLRMTDGVVAWGNVVILSLSKGGNRAVERREAVLGLYAAVP